MIERKFVGEKSWLRRTVPGRVLSTLVVFAFCNIAWILFRANSISDAGYVLVHIFDGIKNPITYIKHAGIGEMPRRIAYFFLFIVILGIYDFFNKDEDVIDRISKRPVICKIFYIVLSVMVVVFSQKGVATEFIYFQF